MEKYIKISLWFLILILFSIAITFLLFSRHVSYDIIKPIVFDKLKAPEKAHLFSQDYFNKTVYKIQILSFVIIIISGTLIIIRKRLCCYIAQLHHDLLQFLRYLRDNINIWQGLGRIGFFTFSIIFIVAIGMRVAFLFQPIRYDEAYNFMLFASKPLYFGLSFYPYFNNHLLNTFLVHVVYIFFGNQPWLIRLPAFVAGVALIPLTFLTARLFYHRHAALVAAALVASSSVLIEFATNARGYTMLVAIFLLNLSLATLLATSPNRGAWLIFAALSALGFYAIPIMVYPYAVLLIWLFSSIIKNNRGAARNLILIQFFWSMVWTGIFVLVLYTPVFLGTTWELIGDVHLIKPQPFASFINNLALSMQTLFQGWNRDMPLSVVTLLVIGVFVATVFHKQVSQQRIPLLPCIFLGIIPILLFQRVVPFHRVWLFLVPVYLTMAAAGITYLIVRCLPQEYKYTDVILLILVIILLAWNNYLVFRNQSILHSLETGVLADARNITLLLKDDIKPETNVIAMCPSDYPLKYYFDICHIPTNVINPKTCLGKSLYVVVNDSNNQTLSMVLEDRGVNTHQYKHKLYKVFETGRIYLLEKNIAFDDKQNIE